MSTELVKNGEAKSEDAKGVKLLQLDALYESLALRGDVSMLKAGDKVAYYRQLCERLGLDPMSQPFLPLKLNGKEVFYASRAATDQLARLHNVTREVISREQLLDVYIVKVRASLPSGRFEESIGAVSIGGLKGEALANGLMKTETKAKRRSTLSLLGLGMLDESELETIPARSIERLAPLQVSSAPFVEVIEPAEPDHEATAKEIEASELVGPGVIGGDEHMRLQARLLEELQTLRDLGISYTESQAQMKRVVGKGRRDELTNDELEKVIASFCDWSKEIAETLKSK